MIIYTVSLSLRRVPLTGSSKEGSETTVGIATYYKVIGQAGSTLIDVDPYSREPSWTKYSSVTLSTRQRLEHPAIYPSISKCDNNISSETRFIVLGSLVRRMRRRPGQ